MMGSRPSGGRLGYEEGQFQNERTCNFERDAREEFGNEHGQCPVVQVEAVGTSPSQTMTLRVNRSMTKPLRTSRACMTSKPMPIEATVNTIEEAVGGIWSAHRHTAPIIRITAAATVVLLTKGSIQPGTPWAYSPAARQPVAIATMCPQGRIGLRPDLCAAT